MGQAFRVYIKPAADTSHIDINQMFKKMGCICRGGEGLPDGTIEYFRVEQVTEKIGKKLSKKYLLVIDYIEKEDCPLNLA